MVADKLIQQAVSRIRQRSERQEDLQKLLGTFVDVGILPQIVNQNNQIFYGRRGTGKTHVLKVLGAKLEEEEKNTVAYIDARTLGSTSQFSDPTVSLSHRCLALFRDILIPIYDVLLERIVEKPTSKAEQALEYADSLISAITIPYKDYREESVTRTTTESKSEKAGLGVTVEPHVIFNLQAKAGVSKNQKEQLTKSYNVEIEDKVIFPDLYKNLSETLSLADTYLFILLDEWSSLPPEIQPYLAEFIKRGILPVQRATIKIASLEYRSHFSLINSLPFIGFELGADIATAPDLDEYYVFDRNPEQITNAYADMLFRHINSELPEKHLQNHHRVNNGGDLSSRLFTERGTFKELARASEGVVRDLINIFTLAFFHAHRRGRSSVDRKAILEAARQWFEQDKSQYLDEKLQSVLRRIVDEVIGNRSARSFLIPRELEKHPIIQRLFDLRILHQIRRGYADKDNPGVRYNIYSLDYGTYVDLLGTSKQPQIDFLEQEIGTDLIVPFDDKRSIRRIILSEEVLS